MLAAAHRGGNGNVIFAAILPQEHGKDDKKCRKSCDIFSRTHLLELHPQRIRQRPHKTHGTKTPGMRTRHVWHQIEARQVREFAEPIVSLSGGFFRLHPLVEPVSKVAVLNRQFGKWRWQSAGKSIVESKELIINQIIGNKIRDEVMESEHDYMLMFSHAEKNRSNQRAIQNVKRPASVGCNQSLQTLVPVFHGKLRNLYTFQRNLKLRSHYRPGLAVNFWERCTEILVAAHHFINGAFHGINTQVSFQPMGMGMVEVMDIGVHLMQQPQMFLLGRDWIIQGGTALNGRFGLASRPFTPQPLLQHFALGWSEPGHPLLIDG